jgi:hypothetical protein
MIHPPAALFLAFAALSGTACSLVTVPVKVAGDIVETTVKTTGDIIAAPFNAIGGNGDDKKKKSEAKDAPPASQPSAPASSEKDTPPE